MHIYGSKLENTIHAITKKEGEPKRPDILSSLPNHGGGNPPPTFPEPKSQNDLQPNHTTIYKKEETKP